MNIVELTKKELMKLLSNKNEKTGMGSYGFLKEYNDTTLIKIYYNDIIQTYSTLDENELEKEITFLLSVDETLKEENPNYIDNLQRLKNTCEALKKTKSSDLIKGIATYRGYPIGVLLENFKHYFPLCNVYYILNKKEQIKVLKQVKKLIKNLFKNNIFPTDIKGNNILVNLETLDVKLIDLDDKKTKIQDDNELNKKICIRKFKFMCEVLNNKK